MPEHVKKKLEEEIKVLEYELTNELPKEIKKAAALGDLSENAEYHMAKQRQVFVNARLGQLKKRLGELAMINLTNLPKDKIAFGSTVKVYDSTKDEELEYKLVTSEEADVAKGLISTTSPIGRSLMGKRVGDTAVVVTPSGNRELDSEAKRHILKKWLFQPAMRDGVAVEAWGTVPVVFTLARG